MDKLVESYDFCRQLVAKQDYERYICAVLGDKRNFHHHMALLAFNTEIARIGGSVQNAITGEIRLQWWRDQLNEENKGNTPTSPVVHALRNTIVERNLPRDAFMMMLDGRAFDLYNDPMPDTDAFETYVGETASTLFRLMALISGVEQSSALADVAGHAGVAYATVGLMRSFPKHASNQQFYLPFSIFQQNGVSLDDVYAGKMSKGVTVSFKELADFARKHRNDAFSAIGGIQNNRSAKSAFLPLHLIEPYLRILEHPKHDPFRDLVSRSNLGIFCSALLGALKR